MNSKYCYWVSWLHEEREPQKNEKPRLVKVTQLGHWVRVWMKEYKQPGVGELIVRGWASKFFGVDFNDVQVLRMTTEDRHPGKAIIQKTENLLQISVKKS
jgi:hypothetical protein